MFLDVDVSELKTVHAAAKKLIGKNTGASNSILLESSANKLIAKIVTGGNWLQYEAKLRGNSKGEGAFIIPMDKLEALANAPAKTKVSFTGDGSSQVNVVVDSGNFSRQYKLECPPLDDFQDITPPELAEIDSATFLSHLNNAIDCTAATPSRYALNMVQLDGDNGRVIGCDGHHLFIGNSMAFPFKGKLHLNVDALLKSKSIRKGGPVAVGVSNDRFFLRIGQWTIGQQCIEGRYPNIDEVLPKDSDITNAITFTDQQAKTILEALDILPGKDQDSAIVKLAYCNGLTLSANDPDSNAETSIIIEGAVIGQPKTTSFNRKFLIQSIEAGFRVFHVLPDNGAVFATGNHSLHLFMAIKADDDEAQKEESTRAGALQEPKVNGSAHAYVPAISQEQTGNVPVQPSTSLRKENTMENQGTATITPPTENQTGKPEGQKPAPTTGLHPLPTPPNNEITADTINTQIANAKEAIRMANNALYELQAAVKEFVRQSKEREKQNNAALRTLENIKRMAA